MPSSKVKPQTSGRRMILEDGDLNDQQWLFVKEYCVDLNGEQASLRAGYKQRNRGAKLLTLPKIVAAIKQELGKRARKAEVEAERVLYELALVAFSDPKDLFDPNSNLLEITRMPEAVRRSIASIEVETRIEKGTDAEVTTARVKFWDKLKALELLGKHLALFGTPKEDKHAHLHLHGNGTDNPYLNADPEVLLQGQRLALAMQQSAKKRAEE